MASKAKGPVRQHYAVAQSGKLPKKNFGPSTVHPKPYAKGGKVGKSK